VIDIDDIQAINEEKLLLGVKNDDDLIDNHIVYQSVPKELVS
jgi:hypothetical protein